MSSCSSMADLELTRTSGDRRAYVLDGIGTLRLQGFASRGATSQAGGAIWRITRRGFWQRRGLSVEIARGYGQGHDLVVHARRAGCVAEEP